MSIRLLAVMIFMNIFSPISMAMELPSQNLITDLTTLKAEKAHDLPHKMLTDLAIKQIKSCLTFEQKLQEIDHLRAQDKRFNRLLENADAPFTKSMSQELKLDNLTQEDKRSRLYDAAKKGQLWLVKYLLNVQEFQDNTFIALHLAAQEGQVKIVKFLLTKGANPNAPFALGVTPLQFTLSKDIVNKNHEKVLRILLKHNAQVNAQSIFDLSVLHNAVHTGNTEIANLLIEKGALMNAQDINGNTALHHAVINNDKEMVMLLLEKGADIAIENNTGKLAFHLVQSREIQEVLFRPR